MKNAAVYVVLGTKAQLIKMAPIMCEMRDRGMPYTFIHTGQHKETMTELLANFGLPSPDHYLYKGKEVSSVARVPWWMLTVSYSSYRHRKKLFPRKGIVLAHGDTFSTVLAAIVGRITGQKIGHVESGLRSFKIFNPFPEELNRLVTFSLTSIYFCPGKWAIKNLSNYSGEKVDCKGNTIADAVRLAAKADAKISLTSKPYVIFSIHRFENIFNKVQLEKILDIMDSVSRQLCIVFIIHPPTLKRLEAYDLLDRLRDNKNIVLSNRLDFFSFNSLLLKSEFVVTDGGSNQEECYYTGKPCLLLRNYTERTEGIGENVVLSKFNPKVIDKFVRTYKTLAGVPKYQSMNPSAIIVDRLEKFQ